MDKGTLDIIKLTIIFTVFAVLCAGFLYMAVRGYLSNLRGDIGMKETMNLLSIEGEKSEKKEKLHIGITHGKNERGSD